MSRHDPRRLVAAAYPWSVTLDTRFGDLDANAHLNNVAVARLFEEARLRFHTSLGVGSGIVGRTPFVVAQVAVDYLAEGGYPAPVAVTCAMLARGTTSWRAGMAMFQGGVCIGLCDAVLVHRGPAGPAPLPEGLRAALGDFALRA